VAEGGVTLYLAYGSNLDVATMMRRCPGARPVARATLVGYRLAFRSVAGDVGVATVVPDAGSVVPGAVYEITAADLASLDRCEGTPWLYRRARMTAGVEGFGPRRVLLYVLNDAADAQPHPSYLATIAAGYREWGLPTDGLLRAAAMVEGERRAV
jgi:gamma-glutamylcyclotransferase (GGCT)/AIG2-like uncharacterized protein YtfP